MTFVLLIIWAFVTVSLAIWWLYFGMKQLSLLLALDQEHAATIVRYQKMLLWEGGTLVVLLIAGAAALAAMILREKKQNQTIRDFFSTFSHQLKTPIANLVLQADLILERLHGKLDKQVLEDFVTETNNLKIRLDNSLSLATLQDRKIFLEAVSGSEVISDIARSFAHLKMALSGDAVIRADRRTLETVLENIFENAYTHGKATMINISFQESQESVDTIELKLNDNGSGFPGDVSGLGNFLERHYASSGSGLGLYLVKQLMAKMGGKVEFLPSNQGFAIKLIFFKA